MNNNNGNKINNNYNKDNNYFDELLIQSPY